MNIEPPPDTEESRAVASQATAEIARKFKARQRIPEGWLGYGSMGLIGWSIVLPMMLGATLGHWLDADHPTGLSWMFVLPMTALVLGSINVAYWAFAAKRATPPPPSA